MSDNTQDKSYNLEGINLINTWGEVTNLSFMLVSMNIYESIFTNGTKGSILIEDNIGLIESLPLIGEEQLEIEFYVHESDVYKKTFNIYSVKNVKNVEKRLKTYMIEFISPAVEINQNTRFSKGYMNKTNDDIVKDVWSELNIDDEIDAEFTDTASRLVVPNWTPFRTLRWLCENSVSSSGYSDFVFFENRDGWWWRTLSEMKLEDSDMFVYWNASKSAMVPDRNTIEEIKAIRLFNTFENTKNGLYASKSFNMSLCNKKFDTTYLYASTDERRIMPKLGDYSTFVNRGRPENFDLDSANSPSSDWSGVGKEHITKFESMIESISNDPETVYNNKDKHNLMRKSTLQAMNSQIYNVKVPGDPNRICGNILHILLPSSIENYKHVDNDDLYSGKYLITAINHSFTIDEYQQVIEVRSDAVDREMVGG